LSAGWQIFIGNALRKAMRPLEIWLLFFTLYSRRLRIFAPIGAGQVLGHRFKGSSHHDALICQSFIFFGLSCGNA
jgi:hypothetical protein